MLDNVASEPCRAEIAARKPVKRYLARVRIAGSGTSVPPTQLSSLEIDRRLGRPPGTTEKRVGVASRPVVRGETSSSMAIEAAWAAIAGSGIAPGEIDLILSASAVPEQPIPATAPLVQAGLGLARARIPAFDVNASCLSFVTAFDIAAQMIEAKRARNVLVVSSEIASRALPWGSDPDTAALFGDGAAAVVLSPCAGAAGGVAAFHMETWPEGYRACELASGGTRNDLRADWPAFLEGSLFRMDGKESYRLAARVIEPFFATLLGKAGWRWSEVDLVVPHQASRGALDHLVRRLGLPAEKVVDIIADHGNQIAASIPTALHHAVQAGRAGKRSRIVVVGTSAGFSVGGFCFEMA